MHNMSTVRKFLLHNPEDWNSVHWDRFSLPPWCNADYMRVCAKSIDWQTFWVQQGYPEAKVGLFLQSYSRFGIRRAFPPFLATASGPFRLGEPRKHWDAENRLVRESTNALLGYLEKSFDHVLLYPANWDMRVFYERGWRLQPRWTVSHQHALHSEFGPEVRRPLRRAQEAELRLVPWQGHNNSGTDLWSRFGEAFARTFHKQNIPLPGSLNATVNLMEGLLKNGGLEGWCVVDKNTTPQAYALMVNPPDSGVWTMWYACSLPDAEKSQAMPFLIHELILESSRRGNLSFDLGGVDYSQLAFFKEHFGNNLIQKFEAHWFRSKIVAALWNIYNKSRKS